LTADEKSTDNNCNLHAMNSLLFNYGECRFVTYSPRSTGFGRDIIPKFDSYAKHIMAAAEAADLLETGIDSDRQPLWNLIELP